MKSALLNPLEIGITFILEFKFEFDFEARDWNYFYSRDIGLTSPTEEAINQ